MSDAIVTDVVLRSVPVAEREHKLSLLLEVAAQLAREVELDTLLRTLGARIAGALHAERATIYLVDAATGELRSQVADLPEIHEIRLPPGKGIAGHVAETGKVLNVVDASQDPRYFAGVDQKTGYTTRTMLAAPIQDSGGAIRGVVQVLNKLGGTFTPEDEAFVLTLASQVAQAFERTTLRPHFDSQRGVALRGPFNHIVGSSAPMQKVYELIGRAAATDATVLLRGETGAGKGLFARAIHANCARHDKPMVTVDCTTLPAPLVESELFGHERGAYTGADKRVPGRIESAQGGTVFLDEVGELSPGVQAKLLRFLQDHTFERVGGRVTLHADVRVIAATHRNLEQLVSHGEFRPDLFYRLRVVEVEVPPLRDRGGDEILRLADHFLGIYGRRHRREGVSLSLEASAALRNHVWPGNVRELEYTIERSVVLAPGALILPEHLGIVTLPSQTAVTPSTVQSLRSDSLEPGVFLPHGLSLREVERRYVRASLEQHDGNITHAAQQLGVGRHTLRRKID